jgi:hypothetical protein
MWVMSLKPIYNVRQFVGNRFNNYEDGWFRSRLNLRHIVIG